MDPVFHILCKNAVDKAMLFYSGKTRKTCRNDSDIKMGLLALSIAGMTPMRSALVLNVQRARGKCGFEFLPDALRGGQKFFLLIWTFPVFNAI